MPIQCFVHLPSQPVSLHNSVVVMTQTTTMSCTTVPLDVQPLAKASNPGHRRNTSMAAAVAVAQQLLSEQHCWHSVPATVTVEVLFNKDD